MVRAWLHVVLSMAVLASPLVCCCCSEAAPVEPASQQAAERPCCCQEKETPRTPAGPTPQHQCPCKQKDPRAVTAKSDDARPFQDLLRFEVPAAQLDTLPAPAAARDTHLDQTVWPASWFTSAPDILRALQTLRL